MELIKKYSLAVLFALTVLNFLTPVKSSAAEPCAVQGPQWLKDIGITDGLIIPCNCIQGDGSQCRFPEMIQVALNISQLILGIVGSLALLMFVYGGFMFIISQGNEQKVTSARQILSNAAIGIVIVFASWIIVNTVLFGLTGQGSLAETVKIFGREWNKAAE
ncbi:hypothetical protein C4569_04035 [Candidatus Parcubacteria bacterium]|nr:MAG: hypothetical protein C4569_04035 [Candidatus Parcubacteria bacterium]